MIIEEMEIKKEEAFIKEEICSSSSLDVQEEYVKMENTEIKGINII